MTDILTTTHNGVLTITLNRPSTLNAFNDPMIVACVAALEAAATDAQVRCVILTGAGRGFSSGQDLSDIRNRPANFSIAEHLQHGYHRLVKAIITLDKPVIAAVNGIAAGAGCGVALACDMRIAADNAAFMLAFSKIGLIPDSAVNWVLPRMIGYARAYEMAVTADKVTAERALTWGMVNQVVPAADLPAAAQALAERFAAGATRAYGLAKRAMWRSFELSLDAGLALEAELQQAASETADFREGVNAFLEKRPAKFSGA